MRGVLRTYDSQAFTADQLAAAKGGQRVSVCIPARNEGATVGAVVSAVRRALVERVALVDEILVVDDHSTDDTAAVAAAAGARVVDARHVLTDHGSGHGKGEALWKSLHEASGDIIAWVDADIVGFDASFVVGLIGPLVTDPDTSFVKGFYERPELGAVGGGRVTELAARPLLSMYFPELTGIVQPLAGEYAGRRAVLEQLPFVVGYGVDVALLIDAARTVGVSRLAQVDLGVRHHRNRSLAELGPQALAVIQVILDRAGVKAPDAATLLRPGREPVEVTVEERPPLISVDGYRRRTA
ncbi:MAG: glucosyl-3-phosphoglycerate synthase [Acidimicrobiales bacterium]|nr:glucosyl-3-phosphoglycerate synthase [Acidimicrobiales bacterium]